MEEKKHIAGMAFFAAGEFFVGTQVAQADSYWNGATNSNWADAGNWGGTAPGSADIAVFNSTTYANPPVVEANTVPAVLGLQFGDGVVAAAALTLDNTLSAAAGQVTSGDTTSGSNTITLVDTSGTAIGQQVTGSNIPTGTFVTGISGNVITLSQPTSGGTLNSGTQLTFNSSLKIGASGVTVTAKVAGIQNLAATVVLTSNQTWTNNATLNNALTISGGIYLGTFTLTLHGATGSNISLPSSGALNGSGALIVDTAGSVTFGGTRPNNPFTGGVTLNSGTMIFSGGGSGSAGVAGALGTGILTINGGQLNGAGNIAGHALTMSGQVWNADWTDLNSKRIDMGAGGVTLGTAAGASRTITVNSNSDTRVYLAVGGAISDGTTANSLIKAGAGVMNLYGASTYTGSTTVNAGTLRLGVADDRLPTTTTLAVNGGSTAATAGTFDLAGLNQTVAGLTGGSGTIQGVVTNSVIDTVSTLTVTGTSTFDGILSGAGVGSVALAKSTGGTLTLTGANTFSGGTTVSGGSLVIASTGTAGAGATAGVHVLPGATLELDGFSTIDDTATLSLFSLSSTVLAYTGQEAVGSLVLNGVLQGQGTYGSSISGAQFQNDAYFSGTGVVAVPEPVGFCLIGLGTAGLLARRRRNRVQIG